MQMCSEVRWHIRSKVSQAYQSMLLGINDSLALVYFLRQLFPRRLEVLAHLGQVTAEAVNGCLHAFALVLVAFQLSKSVLDLSVQLCDLNRKTQRGMWKWQEERRLHPWNPRLLTSSSHLWHR